MARGAFSMKLPRTRYDKVKLFEDHPDWPEAARLFRNYVQIACKSAREICAAVGRLSEAHFVNMTPG